MKAFGDKLKAMRMQAGLTQKELGNILHVSYQAVSKWETNRGLPDPSLFPDIARALNTSVNRLFYEDGEFLGEISPNIDENDRENENKTNEDSKKSVYKPVKRKFWVFAAAVFVCIVLTVSLLIVNFDRQKALKSQLDTAFYVFLQEDNVEVTADYNGAVYRFARKYFFDGRVLMYYADENAINYFYEGTLYFVKDGNVKTETISYDDYLGSLPEFYSLSLSADDLKHVDRTDDEYKIRLKNHDNLPIARLFGFSEKADVRIFLKNGKIVEVLIFEDENKLSLFYKFGYDFQIELPDYINP